MHALDPHEVLTSQLFACRSQGVRLSRDTLMELVIRGWVIDARAGGLIVGRSHAAGNIYMLRDGKEWFSFHGHVQGGEYITSHQSFQKHGQRLIEINSASLPDPPSLAASAQRTLNTNATPFDKILLIDHRGQFIVNHRSTFAHLDELERLNESHNDFLHCDLNCLTRKERQP